MIQINKTSIFLITLLISHYLEMSLKPLMFKITIFLRKMIVLQLFTQLQQLFFNLIIGSVFLHVGLTYLMVDFKKKKIV
jgi:hypothetical protein